MSRLLLLLLLAGLVVWVPGQDAVFDPLALVHIRSASDAIAVRANIIRDIWKVDTLPKNLVVEVADRAPFFGADNIASSQVITRTMDPGLKSHVYFYRAKTFSDCLLIYHSGHGEDIADELKSSLWKRAIDGGCDLLYAAMPLMHQNPQPVVITPLGPLQISSHDILSQLKSDKLNPLKFFVEPVLASLDYAEEQRGGYRFVFMAGLSGGGWTTTLYAAIDPRISASFPVAGSQPFGQKTFRDANVGDWEQHGAGIYDRANYLDLYVLATYPARTQVQLLNVHDPCCYGGTGARAYAGLISEFVKAWGGSFAVSFDEKTVQHEMSAQHVETIMETATTLSGVVFPARSAAPEQ